MNKNDKPETRDGDQKVPQSFLDQQHWSKPGTQAVEVEDRPFTDLLQILDQINDPETENVHEDMRLSVQNEEEENKEQDAQNRVKNAQNGEKGAQNREQDA